jgi:hypothetical protein
VPSIPVSGQLRNERLALALLSSLKSDSAAESQSLQSSTRAVVQPRTILYFMSFDPCVSKFHSHSIDEPRFLDGQALHRLLSSDCLAVEREESLWRLLLDLEVNRSAFLRYIEVSFLSKDGITLFLGEGSFEEFVQDIWGMTCGRAPIRSDLIQ